MAQKIDRNTTTPFLLKLFFRADRFHRTEEFTPTHQPSSHLQIYTWPTCSLRELSHLITSTLPKLLPDPAAGTRLAFRLIYPDTRSAAQGRGMDVPGHYLAKELGSVVVGEDVHLDANGTNGEDAHDGDSDADKMLQDAKFVIGDWVACAILPPLANGQVAPPPEAIGPPSRPSYGGGGGRNGMGGMRENGFGGGSFRGGYGRGPRYGDRGPGGGGAVPTGEWRRGERLPDRGNFVRQGSRGW